MPSADIGVLHEGEGVGETEIEDHAGESDLEMDEETIEELNQTDLDNLDDLPDEEYVTVEKHGPSTPNNGSVVFSNDPINSSNGSRPSSGLFVSNSTPRRAASPAAVSNHSGDTEPFDQEEAYKRYLEDNKAEMQRLAAARRKRNGGA